MTDTFNLNDNATLQQIIDGFPSALCIIDRDRLSLRYANKKFRDYYGHSLPGEPGCLESFLDLLTPADHLRFRNQLSRLHAEQQPQSGFVLYNILHANGSKMPSFVRASHFEGANGEQQCYVTIAPDYGTFKMPILSNDTSDLFLQQFKDEHFGTFEWMIAEDKVYWSPGIYKIYEVEENNTEFSRNFVTWFMHPADREKSEKILKKAMATGETIELEYRIITARRNTKVIHALGKRIDNWDGRPLKFIGSVRDITERKEIEENLRNKVKELNDTNRELEEFAYIASHDMQEPLRKITTFSSRLQEKYGGMLNGEGAMYLSRMTASAENMRRLINDLLDFSRISNTQQPFEFVNLTVAMREVKTDLELVIEETGTTLEFTSLPVIEAVYSQMKQLFTNIVSNAIKFHKEGVPPVINITSGPVDRDEVLTLNLDHNMYYEKITITDNGIGFEPEYAQRIFHVFQRLHGRSEYPGTGIGLAICKKIVEYHKGFIHAESSPGMGASFFIIIPSSRQTPVTNANEP